MRLRRYRFNDFIKMYDKMERELYIYRSRLSMELSKVSKRLEDIHSYIEIYRERGDLETAAIYAREYNVLYIVRELIWHTLLRLEGVMGRIDTIKKFISAFDGMNDTLKAVNDVAKVVGYTVRGFEDLTRELYSGYEEIVVDASVPVRDGYIFPVEDAKEILRSIEKDVVEELSRKFPVIPRDADVSPEGIPTLVNRLYEAIATDGGVSTTREEQPESIGVVRIRLNREYLHRVARKKLDRLERLLLNHIMKGYKGGVIEINIFRLARIYRTTPMKVLDTLYSLGEEGIVSFV